MSNLQILNGFSAMTENDVINNIQVLTEELRENFAINKYIALKNMRDTADAALENTKDLAIDAAKDLNKNEFYYNALITTTSRKTYDYDFCNDARLNELKAELNRVKLDIKARELILQTGRDSETGEELQRPVEVHSQVLTIKRKKN